MKIPLRYKYGLERWWKAFLRKRGLILLSELDASLRNHDAQHRRELEEQKRGVDEIISKFYRLQVRQRYGDRGSEYHLQVTLTRDFLMLHGQLDREGIHMLAEMTAHRIRAELARTRFYNMGEDHLH